jgi:hypothetical protein
MTARWYVNLQCVFGFLVDLCHVLVDELRLISIDLRKVWSQACRHEPRFCLNGSVQRLEQVFCDRPRTNFITIDIDKKIDIVQFSNCMDRDGNGNVHRMTGHIRKPGHSLDTGGLVEEI